MSETVRPTAAQAQTNLHAVLHLVAPGRLRCSQTTHRPAATTVAAVADVLGGGDFYPDKPIAAFAWPLLVQAGGLAELAGGRLQLTDRGRAAPVKPAAATIRRLWRSWVTTTLLDEFNRVDEIKGQRAANVLTSVKTRRKAVATALADCPRDEWTATDDLFATMRRNRETSPTVARSERALWKLYLVDPQYGSLGYSGFADWPILEGRYTLAVLFEYAATLGLIDVDYTDPAGARTDYHDNWGADDLGYLSRYDARHPTQPARRLRTRADWRLPTTRQHHGAGTDPEGPANPGHRRRRRPHRRRAAVRTGCHWASGCGAGGNGCRHRGRRQVGHLRVRAAQG